MAEFLFLGLGLWDEEGATRKAARLARGCDVLFAEFYTSRLEGTTLERLEAAYGKEVRVLGREEVEDGTLLLEAARRHDRVGLLVAGDPMAATTHVDLRLRLHRAGVATRVVPGVSALTAAAGALGLQVYKFGRTTTLPIREPGYAPTSPYEVLATNREAGLHTLALLDIREDGGLTPREGMEYLLECEAALGRNAFREDTLACVVGRLGSPEPTLRADRVHHLLEADPGPPLHTLVVPGQLHFLEVESLVAFAGMPASLAKELSSL